MVKVCVERRSATGERTCYDRATVVNERVWLYPEGSNGRGKKVGHAIIKLSDGRTVVQIPDSEIFGWFGA